MNIISETKNKLSRRVLGILNTQADHERPQDDVPDEVILRYLRNDYHKMLHERHILINYIRRMENIYKETQMRLLILTSKNYTKNRLKQEMRLLDYDITRSHMDAQAKLRDAIGETQSRGEPQPSPPSHGK